MHSHAIVNTNRWQQTVAASNEAGVGAQRFHVFQGRANDRLLAMLQMVYTFSMPYVKTVQPQGLR
jgi:hypothetical protein